MVSFRTAETQRKEFDLQSVQTTKINLEIQRYASIPENDYRSRLEDIAMFANVLREVAPVDSLVVLHYAPEIIFTTETEDFSVNVYMSANMWRFKVNGSTHYELAEEDKLGPTRALKKLWDVTIPRLPEGFIIRGNTSTNDPEDEARARNIGRQRLGFSDIQANGEVYGIVREGKLVPLSLDEFLILTGIVPAQLSQKFSVRKIDWRGV